MTRSKEDAEWWWVLNAETTQETVEMDSLFLRRRQEIVIPQDNWSIGSSWWYVGWGKNMHIRSSREHEKSLIKSYKKKGSPVPDVSAVR